MKLELLKDHEHAGRQYRVGASLDTNADTARWLIEHGVAKAASVKPSEPKRKPQQQED